MGVRESVAQQPEEEMRLQEMTVENKAEKKPSFDAQEFFLDSDWTEIKTYTEGLIEDVHDESQRNSVTMANNMVTVFPSRIEEIRSLNRCQKTVYQVDNEISLYGPLDDYLGNMLCAEYAKNLRTIFPEKVNPAELFKESKWQSLVNKTLCIDGIPKHSVVRVREDVLLRESAAAKILFPEAMKNYCLTWKDVEELLQRPGRSTEDFFVDAARARIIFPAKIAQMKLCASPQWEKSEQQLQRLVKEKKWFDATALAAAMQILAAEKVIIDENGLRLVMPEKTGDFKEEKPKLPERRKF